MRKLVVAMLAVPVLATLYAQVGLRRSVGLRLALTIGIGGLVGLLGLGMLGTAETAARPAATIRPVAQSDFSTTLRTGHGLHEPIDIDFSRPMDAASVAAAFSIEPLAAVRLSWDASETRLTVAPVGPWSVDTYYAISVGASALDRDGAALGRPARAAFLTRPATVARIALTSAVRGLATLDSAFELRFDAPVRLAAVRAAFATQPAVAGSVVIDGPSMPDAPTGGPTVATSFRFVPDAPLSPGTAYRAALAALDDADGAPVEVPAALAVRTVASPTVVRFRPVAGTTGVARGAALSVRFSAPMDTAATAAAFSVSVNGSPLTGGSARWAEGRTVLVLQPRTSLPYGAKVTMSVAAGARAATGAPLAAPASATFTVVPRPAPPARPAPAPRRATSTSISRPAATSGSWYAVEVYYLRLMNCTRTGGWVTSSGSCSSPGGRNVAPLRLDSGISSKVSRPYAKYLAVHNACSHFIGGTPGDRLRRAGYTSYRWAENLGCRSGDPYAAVLGSHLFFQSEKSYGGGHYVNLMNALYDRVGIGVWVYAGRVRLVVDFYHP